MASIAFFQQRRKDGGTRSGIDVNGRTVLEHFEEGKGEPDPSLVWYVDVRCDGPRLPRAPSPAQHWLIDKEPRIVRGIQELAAKLTAGIDSDEWPLQHSVPGIPGVRVTIVCSAMRRVEAKRIAAILRDIAAHWNDRVAAVTLEQPV